MGLALFKERRATDRRKLTGLLPGRLKVKGSDMDLQCRPVDISETGIGIVITGKLKPIEPGTHLVLEVGDQAIELVVSWRRPDFGKQDAMRYGIIAGKPDQNLEALFIEHGCLR